MVDEFELSSSSLHLKCCLSMQDLTDTEVDVDAYASGWLDAIAC